MRGELQHDPARELGPPARRRRLGPARRPHRAAVAAHLPRGRPRGRRGRPRHPVLRLRDHRRAGAARARADPGRGRADDPLVGRAAGAAVRRRAGDGRRGGQRRGGRAAWRTCVLGVDARNAVILGSIVASTDAAAVFSVLRKLPLLPRLRSALEAESGLNDAPVVVLVVLASSDAWATTSVLEGLGIVAFELVGGAVLGLALGRAGRELLARVALPAAGLYPLATVGAVPAGLRRRPGAARQRLPRRLPRGARARQLDAAAPPGRARLRRLDGAARRGGAVRPARAARLARPAAAGAAGGAAHRRRRHLPGPAAGRRRVGAAVPDALARAGVPVVGGAARRGAHRHRDDPGHRGAARRDAGRRRRVRPRRRLHAGAGADAAVGRPAARRGRGRARRRRRGRDRPARAARRRPAAGAGRSGLAAARRLRRGAAPAARRARHAHRPRRAEPRARPAHALRARRPGARGRHQRGARRGGGAAAGRGARRQAGPLAGRQTGAERGQRTPAGAAGGAAPAAGRLPAASGGRRARRRPGSGPTAPPSTTPTRAAAGARRRRGSRRRRAGRPGGPRQQDGGRLAAHRPAGHALHVAAVLGAGLGEHVVDELGRLVQRRDAQHLGGLGAVDVLERRLPRVHEHQLGVVRGCLPRRVPHGGPRALAPVDADDDAHRGHGVSQSPSSTNSTA